MSFRNNRVVLFLAGVLVAVGSVLADVKVGSPFPDLQSYNLEGSLPDLKGRVVLVDFWATWCAPCKASFPAYSALQHELGERGFTVLAVSIDKKPEEYAAFIKKFAPGFATVRDARQALVAEVKVPGMPTCYLLDRAGVLREIHSGFHGEATAKELREKILKLLEEKS